MGVSKSILFSEKQNKLATLAGALGHPARIAILQYLIENQSCVVGSLVEKLPLSQSTISQHIKELKNIGLIKVDIRGSSIGYCINREMMLDLTENLNDFIAELNNCC